MPTMLVEYIKNSNVANMKKLLATLVSLYGSVLLSDYISMKLA